LLTPERETEMQNFIGFDVNAMVYNRQYTISGARPGLSSFQNTSVSRIRASVGGNMLEELFGGAFLADGTFIESSAQPRSDGRNAIRLQQPCTIPSGATNLPKAVFGGVAFDHFGHFLLETTSRLWCLPEYRELPWLFLTDGKPALKGYQLDFLELLGLERAQILPVDDWVHVGELVVPEPAFIYHHHVTHAYRDIFRNARLPDNDKGGRRIFVSRGHTTIALTVGERELEEILAQDGWEIVYPEDLPAAAQAGLFRDENIVMGLQGSAMHLGLFAPAGRRVVHLCRGQGYRGYYILDDLIQANATYFQAMAEPALKSKPINGPFLLNLDSTLAFLRAEDLLRQPSVLSGPQGGWQPSEMLRDYEAWWHYTESQMRLHWQVADDGSAVPAEAALDSALKAIEIWPGNAEMLANAVAMTLKFQGVDAAAALLDAQAGGVPSGSDPAAGKLLHLQSVVQDLRGQYHDALGTAEAACRLEPGNATYINQNATILYRLGRLEEARDVLEALIARGAAMSINHALLSVIQEATGDVAGAVAAAREAVRLDGHDERTFKRLVGLLRCAGEEEAAWQAVAQYLEQNQGSTEALLEIAGYRDALGDAEGASAYIRRALAAAPDDAEIQTLYVKHLVQHGIFPDLEFLDREPSPAVCEQAVMLYRRSLHLLEAGRMAEALSVAVIAAELYANNVTIMQHLLGMLLINHRAVEAKLLVNMLIARQHISGGIYYALSLIEAELGDEAASQAAAQRALELEPDNVTIAEHCQRMVALAA